MPYNEEGVWVGEPQDQPQQNLASYFYGGKQVATPGLREINGRQYVKFDPSYWTPQMFYGDEMRILDPYLQAIEQQKVEQDGETWIPADIYAHSQGALEPYSRSPQWEEKAIQNTIMALTLAGGGAVIGGGLAAGAGGAAAADATVAGTTAGTSAMTTANQQALYQMAFDAGLEGAAADAFVASGGTMGSTAAGGGGITGLATAPTLDAATTNPALTPGTPEWDMAQGYNPPAGLPDSPVSGAPGSDTLGKVGTTAASGTALSRIYDYMSGKSGAQEPTTADWLSVLGTAGATGLGMFSANQQANTLKDLAEQNRLERAPYLAASQGYLANPSSYIEGPGQAAMKGTLAALSAKFGNPIGSPAALEIATNAGLRDWRDAVTGFGNMGLSGADTRANLGVQAAGATGNIYSNLAGGISDIINPRRSLADLFRQYQLSIGGSLV